MFRNDIHRIKLKKFEDWFVPNARLGGILDETKSPSDSGGDLKDVVAFTVSTYSTTRKCRVDITFTVEIEQEVGDDYTFTTYCHDLYDNRGGYANRVRYVPAVDTLQIPTTVIALSESLRATFAPIATKLKMDMLGDQGAARSGDPIDAFLDGCGLDRGSVHDNDRKAVRITHDGLEVMSGPHVFEAIEPDGNVPMQYTIRFTRDMLTRAVHQSFALNGWYYLIAPYDCLKIVSEDDKTVHGLLANRDGEDDEGGDSVSADITTSIKVSTPDGARTTAAMVLITFEASHRGEE